MDRFTLKSWSVGFEVPFFNENTQDGMDKLSGKLAKQYKNWSDTLKTEFVFFQLPTQNMLILYTLVIRVDVDLINSDTFKEEWNEVTEGITKVIGEFLEHNKLEYRILKESL
jgi:hypothetical protein